MLERLCYDSPATPQATCYPLTYIAMRLTKQQQTIIKNDIQGLDADARVFLFGSRVDDQKSGGDIDLLIFSNKLDKKQLRAVKWHYYEIFGEQKMDLILDSGKLDTPFVRLIFPSAIEL